MRKTTMSTALGLLLAANVLLAQKQTPLPGSHLSQSFSTLGGHPGTVLTVSLSEPVVRQGRRSDIVFVITNVTNTMVRIPIDEWGSYSVQGVQVAPLYGKMAPMPAWYYNTLKPGEVMSNVFPVFTGPRTDPTATTLPSGIVYASESPYALRIVNPGVTQIVITRSGARLGTMDLTIEEAQQSPRGYK